MTKKDAEEFLEAIAEPIHRLVCAEVVRRVPEALGLALDHMRYHSVANLRSGLWLKFELNRQHTRAEVEKLGLDPDDLDVFEAQARAKLTTMFDKIEAALTGPSVH